jgi:hypothetical protein
MEPDYKVKLEIWCFDFEAAVAPTKPLFEREEKMQLDKKINKYHYACQSSLSIYIATDSKGDIDSGKVLTEEEFFDKTFVSVRYRTHKEKEVEEEKPGFKV